MPDCSVPLNSKLPKVGSSIFTVMSKLAVSTGAINLSQGFPSFDVDPKLISLVEKHMKSGRNQYAPMQGVPELREALSHKAKISYGTHYDANDEITITAGATQAIYTAISALVKEEDEVILFTPAYDCYVPAIELNGGRPVYVQLKAPDYRIDWQQVKKLINHKTKMILINSPHNPTGSILSREDMEELEKITKGTRILVLSDEVYEHIVFDGNKHHSAAAFSELAKRTLIVYSFGKTFHATGWKMGYVLGPKELMLEFRKVHQFNVFSCNTPIQYALAEYLEDESNYLGLGAFYQGKRDFFLNAIKDSRFKCIPAGGTYFQLLSYEGISDLPDTEIAIKWTEEFGIASIPISVFYNEKLDEKMLRFCFAKDEELLGQAAEIINKI